MRFQLPPSLSLTHYVLCTDDCAKWCHNAGTGYEYLVALTSYVHVRLVRGGPSLCPKYMDGRSPLPTSRPTNGNPLLPIRETVRLQGISHDSLWCMMSAEGVNTSILTRLDNTPGRLLAIPVYNRQCPHTNSPSGIALSPTVLNDGDASALHST